jgi:addiction module HigA family antidote
VANKKLSPLHPGEVLREEFLVPLGMSAGQLADICGVPRTRIERIVAETTGISADTALRLSKALSTTPNVWLNLQNEFDLRTAKNESGKEFDKIEPIQIQAA